MANIAPPIHECARTNDIAGVLDELARGTSVDARDPATDRTPLMVAVASPKADAHMVRLLIEKGANVIAVASYETRGIGQQAIEQLQSLVDGNQDAPGDAPTLDRLKGMLDKMKELEFPEVSESQDSALSLAVGTGDLEKIQALLDAGADVRYQRPGGYDVLIDAMHGRHIADDPHLVPLIQLLIDRGANLNTVSDYSESALSVASINGRFDAVRVLLDASADPAPLRWTALMHAIPLGSLDDVRRQLNIASDLSAIDRWSRTPWLLSLQTGDVPKAQLLLAAGANPTDRGLCGETPLMHPIANGHTAMLKWLLSQRLDPNAVDDYKRTALMRAAELGATESVKILLAAGADIHLVDHSDTPAITHAGNLQIVRLLVNRGADLNDISEDMRAALTRLPHDPDIRASRDDYLAARHRRFGKTNPQKMNLPFWMAMVSSGATAYSARQQFDDTEAEDDAVWCFSRFGKSINELPDGRIIEIAGEHEDAYDPDFCIYNDVIVHHGDGTFDIYGYPKEVFPPTDFHTATLVGKYIYVIGSLGYQGERTFGETPVFRLDIDTFERTAIQTSGQKPGWIHAHKASHTGDGRIHISAGKVCQLQDGTEKLIDNTSHYVLDLHTLVWIRQ